MSHVPDPLDSLFVSESQSVNRQQLADILKPYLTINKDVGIFEFSSAFLELQNAEKVLLVLLAVKAKSLVVDGAKDEIGPSEIIKMEIMPEGSVKGTLKTLSGSREIKVANGKYSVPNYRISQIAARLKSN